MSDESQKSLSKRQRLELLPPTNQNNELLQLSDLPPGLAQHIVSFLSLPDRLNLAETCHLAKKEVDTYCEKVLEKIVGHNNCNVDSTFFERIRDQTSIVTQRTKPVHLPPRYLLWVVLRKEPLYKIQLHDYNDDFYQLALSPSQNTILLIPFSHESHIYDLRARQRLAILNSPDWMSLEFLDDTNVISYGAGEHVFRCWSHKSDGGWTFDWPASNLYQVHHNAAVLDFFRVDQHHVLFATTGFALNEPGFLFQKLDTRSSNVDTILAIERHEGFTVDQVSEIRIFGIFNQKWLVFLLGGLKGTTLQSRFQSALCVYDLQTKTNISVWTGDGRFDSLNQICKFTKPGTFCAFQPCRNNGHPRAFILQLNPQNGRLSELLSFPVNRDLRLLALSESHIFFTNVEYKGNAGAPKKVEAFTLGTGQHEWSIDLRIPSRDIVTAEVANIRNELIVVTKHQGVDGDGSLNAFCLKEQQL